MAKLDFPSSPTFNQRYPDPAVPGVPVYTWDTEKWVASGPVGSPPQAPFDAMAYSGMQINGGMEVSQERGTSAVSATALYVCDGWLHAFVGSMVVTSGIALGSSPPGFPNLLYMSCSTAQTTLGASDESSLLQYIEGYRISRLSWGSANAQQITLGFWTAHHRTGFYSGSIRPASGNPSYAFTYNQNVSDVWEYKTVTIPGCTTGTWATDNTIGIIILFANAMGSSKTASSANTWLAGNYSAAPGQINAVAATSDAFRITGVTVLPGTQAPTAAQSPNIMRPYDQELVTCQRYYCNGGVAWSGWITAGQPFVSEMIYYPTSMRAVPTLSFTVNSSAGVGSPASNNFSNLQAQLYCPTTAAGASNFDIFFKADARL